MEQATPKKYFKKTCAIEVLQLYMDRQIMLYSVLWVANYQT